VETSREVAIMRKRHSRSCDLEGSFQRQSGKIKIGKTSPCKPRFLGKGVFKGGARARTNAPCWRVKGEDRDHQSRKIPVSARLIQ